MKPIYSPFLYLSFGQTLCFHWKKQKTKAKQTKQNKNIQKAFFSSLAKPLKMLKVVAIFQTEFQTKTKTRSVLRASIINFQFTAQLKIRLSKETYMQTC